MGNERYDALVVLGAVMRWEGRLGKWTFPLILESDEYAGRLVLGEWRAMAAMILQDSAPVILVTGGSNTHPETGEQCSRAVELAKFIVELGVPREKVIPMGKIGASHTMGNVANLVEYLEEHLEIHRVAILSPRFQMFRAMVMHDRDQKLKRNGLELEWIEVERTLVKHDPPRFKPHIDGIYSLPEADTCWQKEQEGMWALLTGKYTTPRKSA